MGNKVVPRKLRPCLMTRTFYSIKAKQRKEGVVMRRLVESLRSVQADKQR